MAVAPGTYVSAGVDTDTADVALGGILRQLAPTLAYRQGIGRVQLENGFFANVIDVGAGTGIAISTDGVGSKVLIAQELEKFDTIGIDCVAMNVNDVLCVGAEPLALVDYVAVDVASPHILEQIAVGLARGAELARISIPGGEIAQLPEIIRGVAPGRGFDLVGTCIGIVPLERLLIGTRVEDGDVIVGLKSTGIHSNGLTLARKVLFEHGGFTPRSNHKALTSSVGETLLEPTQIYVQPILDMLAAGLDAKALVHITSDGLLNLTRISSAASFYIDYLPEPHPIFTLIQEVGQISDSEMLCTFNMGVGFCVVLAKQDVERAQEIAGAYGIDTYVLGHAVLDGGGKRVVVRPRGLVGAGKRFTPA